MNMSSRKLYALSLKKVRAYMHRRGFDDAVLLANTELNPSDLDDPYRLISPEQARVFYRNVVDLSDDPGIGLEIGWMTSITEKGPLGLMQIVARTVLESTGAMRSNETSSFTTSLVKKNTSPCGFSCWSVGWACSRPMPRN
jgi:hypothetical protein